MQEVELEFWKTRYPGCGMAFRLLMNMSPHLSLKSYWQLLFAKAAGSHFWNGVDTGRLLILQCKISYLCL